MYFIQKPFLHTDVFHTHGQNLNHEKLSEPQYSMKSKGLLWDELNK